MREQTPIPKPAFIVTASEKEINHGLTEFGQDISTNPERYLPIISTVGVMAVASAQGAKLEIDGDRAGVVRHYFQYDFDYDVDYDSATEQALKNDPAYQQLVEERSKMHMIEEYDEHNVKRLVKSPEQRHLSEKIRHARLAFFVNRVVEWQSQDRSNDLRSVG